MGLLEQGSGVGFLARFGVDGRAFDGGAGNGLAIVGRDGLRQRLDLVGLTGVGRVAVGKLIDPDQGQQPEDHKAQGDPWVHAHTPGPQPART